MFGKEWESHFSTQGFIFHICRTQAKEMNGFSNYKIIHKALCFSSALFGGGGGERVSSFLSGVVQTRVINGITRSCTNWHYLWGTVKDHPASNCAILGSRLHVDIKKEILMDDKRRAPNTKRQIPALKLWCFSMDPLCAPHANVLQSHFCMEK